MPNNYTNIAICLPGFDFDVEAFRRQWASQSIFETLLPIPQSVKHDNPRFQSDAEYDWCKENYGTKWSEYDVDAHKLPGDCNAVAVVFCTAWSPPVPMFQRLSAWLKSEYKFTKVVWIGVQPYNDTIANNGGDWEQQVFGS